MGLNFPNPSRTFDEARRLIRFWGYDSAIEISFFLAATALQKITPQMGGAEADILKVFDSAREQIHGIANKVYFRGPKGAYACNLAAEDF